MVEEKKTTIVVSRAVWRKLTGMRQHPQDTHEAVLRRLLEMDEDPEVKSVE